MSTQSKIEVIGHLRFPYNPILRDVFLREIPSPQKIITKDGKVICKQQVSKNLQELLEKKGFLVQDSNEKHLEGRTTVCGVRISVSKDYEGKNIKELLITIKAKTSIELSENEKTLLSGIRKIIPTIKCKSSVTDKFVRC